MTNIYTASFASLEIAVNAVGSWDGWLANEEVTDLAAYLANFPDAEIEMRESIGRYLAARATTVVTDTVVVNVANVVTVSSCINMIARPQAAEKDLLVGNESKALTVRDLDGAVLALIPAPAHGWTHDALETFGGAFNATYTSGWDAFLNIQFIGSSEI